jgi:hypothetical protein
MPTDLEQQLHQFAELLDREAPAISVDEILGRGTVVVDPDRGATSRDGAYGERDLSIELAPSGVERPNLRRPALRIALAAAAAAVLVVALAAIVRFGDEPNPADLPQSTVPSPTTSTVPSSSPTSVPAPSPSSVPAPSIPTVDDTATSPSGPPMPVGMWPQSTLDEVRAAQEGADAGDPAYAWQVDPRLSLGEWAEHAQEPGFEIVERFLREQLGWEEFVFNPYVGDYGCCLAPEGFIPGVVYLRCAPGESNPLYPPGPEPGLGELCAPTLDHQRYESVSIDLSQPDRQGASGIWVVSEWDPTTFTQADPAVVEARARERLEPFLAARLAGQGALFHVQVDPEIEVPLLYATSSGAPYERFEIERVGAPGWPDGHMTFAVRLFADGDATVVEQRIDWHQNISGGLLLDATSTTENGRPVTTLYASEDGEVTVSAPSTWGTFWPGVGSQADVWFGILWAGPERYYETDEWIGLVDPVAYDAWCAENGGSPLLTAPADAASIAQQLIADPNFESTSPVATRIGGLEALSIDVSLAPGGRGCGVGMIEISRWVHSVEGRPELRLRLYLVDLPEGMSVETLAITVIAPEDRFDEYLVDTQPIIDSIQFHPE